MADTRISDLPEATTLDGTELALLSQGAADRKATLQSLRDFDWVKPADWPAMPTTAANTVHLLAAVFDHTSNFAALRVTISSGTYSVDWGDGTSDSGITSATDATHTYAYADGDLPSATARGYKVAVVTITTSGGNITALDITRVPSGTTAHTPPWLEAQINAASCTSFVFTNTSGLSIATLIEHINFVATGTITTHANMFREMARLQKLQYPGTFFTSTTSLNNTFRGCRSLRRIDLSSLGTALTNLTGAFENCVRLKTLTFPASSLGSAFTTMTGAFGGCASLETVHFPSGGLSHVTAFGSVFNGCTSLHNVTFPSGSLGAVTTLSFAFGSCVSLTEIVFPAGSLTAVTTIANAFNGCASLQAITFAAGSLGSVSNTGSAFASCPALSRIVNCLIPVSFNVASCRLSAAALDEIYTALPSASATITVTSNHGTSGDNPTIATAKGWTVTGS